MRGFLNWCWDIRLPRIGLGFVGEVFDVWRWLFNFNGVGLGGFVVEVEINRWCLVEISVVNWGGLVPDETVSGWFPVNIVNEWRWFLFHNVLGSWLAPCPELNGGLFVVFSPLDLGRNVGLELFGFGLPVEVLNAWGWLVIDVVGLSGFIVPVEINDGGVVVFFPNNWGWFVPFVGLSGGFVVLVFNVWGWF